MVRDATLAMEDRQISADAYSSPPGAAYQENTRKTPGNCKETVKYGVWEGYIVPQQERWQGALVGADGNP